MVALRNQHLIRIGLQFHHKNVGSSETETLLSVPLVTDHCVKEMCLAQPIFRKTNQLMSTIHNNLHTNSLETIEWRRGRRRIEPVPLSPATEACGITRGDLLDPFLDARLCCGELGFSDYIFHIASAARKSEYQVPIREEEVPTPCAFVHKHPQV